MRPYRAIPIGGKDFVYGWYAKVENKAYILTGTLDDDGVIWHYTEVIPETVGQQVGLKDKNGKEIYKGDIIEKELFGGLKTKVRVEWIEDSGCFGYKPCTPYNFGSLTKEFVEDFEVIGNTTQHPELMENNK